MNKQEFLTDLRKGLSGLPLAETEERLNFYSEIIDDRIEEGLSEEEAVAEIGTVDQVLSQIIAEIPLPKLLKERAKSKTALKVWEIVLLILGSPIWLSLLIAVFAVILSVYIAIWSVIVALWSIVASLVACSFGGAVAGAVFIFAGNKLTGIAMIGCGVFCAGLSIFLFFGCKGATTALLLLTKKIALWIKSMFIKKEA